MLNAGRNSVGDYYIGKAVNLWSECCTGSGGYFYWRVIAEHKKTGMIVMSQGETKKEAEENIVINIIKG